MEEKPDHERTEKAEKGADLIRAQAKRLPDTPGVYRMIAADGEVLYVGKARSLKRRVLSYTQDSKLPVRLQRMVAQTAQMEFVHTHTEVEALLLESNLIKKLKPRFNILMRDDKSFPYILLTAGHDYPQLLKHRGARTKPGEYFGPFAGAGDVNRTLIALQKAFMLRNCTDAYFAARKRPCLQYHIKRCTAPCVDLATKDEYAAQVRQARDFLAGKSHEVQETLAADMQAASDRQDYERAAKIRDRIRALSAIQARQIVNVQGLGDCDVLALAREGGQCCVQVFFFRGGQNFGNRSYFPRHDSDDPDDAVLGAFMAQFYENKPVPADILVSLSPDSEDLLTEALSVRAGRRVTILCPQRGAKREVVEFALTNARDALNRQMAERAGQAVLLEGVTELFGLPAPPERIEVYDNSHISGTNMVGAMIVAGPEGFIKNAYRKFNIREAKASDDYGMMREVMRRRFAKGKETADRPGLLLIDGGAGQFGTVREVLEELGIAGDIPMVSIAKGEDRNAGRETFFMHGRAPFQLPVNDSVLHYLQRLRDEAHRFAIGAHRTRRKMDIGRSPLDSIPGIGASRKKALLHRFGSAKEVARAGLRDLERVEGISAALARTIYEHFHQ